MVHATNSLNQPSVILQHIACLCAGFLRLHRQRKTVGIVTGIIMVNAQIIGISDNHDYPTLP